MHTGGSMNIHRLKEVLTWAKHWQKWLETQISIKKEIPLNNLTRRLNKAMRSILLNSDPDELTRLTPVVSLDTWQTIGRLLRTDVTLHPNYTERVENQDKDYHFNKAFDEKLAQQEKAKKEYDDLFSNSDSDEAYMAHVVDGDCICWNGDIECGATKEERQDILNWRKSFTQDWWEKNT